MRVTVNGKAEQLEAELSVKDFLRGREVEPIQVAVEINQELVRRADFDSTLINQGDRIEVVTFVGGG